MGCNKYQQFELKREFSIMPRIPKLSANANIASYAQKLPSKLPRYLMSPGCSWNIWHLRLRPRLLYESLFGHELDMRICSSENTLLNFFPLRRLDGELHCWRLPAHLLDWERTVCSEHAGWVGKGKSEQHSHFSLCSLSSPPSLFDQGEGRLRNHDLTSLILHAHISALYDIGRHLIKT